MDFSILIPTRNRPENVLRLVKSIVETSSGENSVEILFYVDEDDILTKEVTKEIEKIVVSSKKEITFAMMNDETGKNWYNKWWSFLWGNSKGKYIMQGGDDLVFSTKNWDIEIANAFREYPDPFVVVYCNDGSCDSADRATHPILTKEWCDELGYFIPGIFAGGYNDTWITEVAKHVNRFHYLPDVLIDHMHPDFGKSKMDDVYSKQREMVSEQDSGDLFEKTKKDRTDDAEKILEKISHIKQRECND